MKTRLIIQFIILTVSLNHANSQTYRTLEQYKEYFINNYKNLDIIEGIWLVKQVVTPAELNTIVTGDAYVAIIKENSEFKEYSLKNGVYIPGNNKVTFYTKGYSQYIAQTFNYAYSETSYDDFVISDNFFQTTNDLTYLVKKQLGYDAQLILKTTYIKTYPLQSDLK